MSFLFGETVFTTLIASTVATAVSSAIVSKLFTKEGVEFTWCYVIKPTCKGLYNIATKSKSTDTRYTSPIIEELRKDKNIVFEILSNETDENGITTTVVVFERKPTLSFDEKQSGFNEPVFL